MYPLLLMQFDRLIHRRFCLQDHQTHYEAVGTIGNLVHSSPEIKRVVLAQGVLQPVINLLQCSCRDSLREAALLIGQFAQCDSRNRHRQARGDVLLSPNHVT
jgi:hypothetical protein